MTIERAFRRTVTRAFTLGSGGSRADAELENAPGGASPFRGALGADFDREFEVARARDLVELADRAPGLRRELIGVAAPPTASRPGLPEIGDVVGGLYRITALLGTGSFGKVYAAERVDVPEHRVALKVAPLDAFPGKNVARELVMLAAAGHPNVVQLKDHGLTRDYLWLTMPMYRGRTLEERLENGPMGLREAWETFTPIARGVAALHAAGLRHQDIKPENIFLAEFAGHLHPILLDLGVAAESNADFCAGTILYASPEQLFAFSARVAPLPLTERMDVYAFGATLLRAIVPAPQYPGHGARSRADIAAAHEARAARPLARAALPGVSAAARSLIGGELAKWMAPHPSERPSMAAVVERLDVLLEPERELERGRIAETESRRRAVRTSARRLRVFAGAVSAVAIAGSGVAYAHRQTLRLAAELSRAEQRGAESFDRLETCDAAHKVALRKQRSCEAGRSRDKTEFDATVDALAQRGQSTDVERTASLTRLRSRLEGRLEACEDERTEARTAHETLGSTSRAEREAARVREAELVAERDAAGRLATERAAALATRDDELAACTAGGAARTNGRGAASPEPARAAPSELGTTTTPSSPAAPAATSTRADDGEALNGSAGAPRAATDAAPAPGDPASNAGAEPTAASPERASP